MISWSAYNAAPPSPAPLRAASKSPKADASSADGSRRAIAMRVSALARAPPCPPAQSTQKVVPGKRAGQAVRFSPKWPRIALPCNAPVHQGKGLGGN